MHGNPLLLILCALDLFLPRALLATDYYVTVAGDDGALGTSPEKAWRSVARVNAGSFRPGDHISFQGGQEFHGSLLLGQDSAGQTNAPVVITSFGGGRAKLLAGRKNGITIDSAGWVSISSLVLFGDGPTNNTGYGILCDNRLGLKRLEHVCVENVEASGFGITGILISGTGAGFDHVRVVSCDVHDNLRGGLAVAGRLPWDSPLYAHTDVVVSRCAAHDNSGDPDYAKNHSGSGIVLYEVDGGWVDECRAWENGQLCTHANGGVGIWTCASRNVVIERCESFGNRSAGGDGGGFDLDGGSIDCVLQHNYSHANDGPGLMVYTYPYASHGDRGNIVRFNVSDNDSRKRRSYAGLWIRSDGRGMTGLKVYNNTVRIGPRSDQAAFVDGNGVEAEFRNNIFVGCAEAVPLKVERPQTRLRFENNLYWAGGAPIGIHWGSQTYMDLADWRQATGQESLDGRPVGIFADPDLASEPDEITGLTATWQRCLAAFKPQRGSVTKAKGLVMESVSPRAQTHTDIWGNALKASNWPLGAVMPDSL
jgi:hypothetical protein